MEVLLSLPRSVSGFFLRKMGRLFLVLGSNRFVYFNAIDSNAFSFLHLSNIR
jgi:hypothetical protein